MYLIGSNLEVELILLKIIRIRLEHVTPYKNNNNNNNKRQQQKMKQQQKYKNN